MRDRRARERDLDSPSTGLSAASRTGASQSTCSFIGPPRDNPATQWKLGPPR